MPALNDDQEKQARAETFRQALFRYAMCVGVPILFAATAAAILFLLPRIVPLSSWVCTIVAAGAVLAALALWHRRETLQEELGSAVIIDGDEKRVRELLASGVRVERGKGPDLLSTAAFNGQKGIVEALIDAGAEVNPRAPEMGAPPLLMAVLKGDEEIVRILLAAGADPNAKGGDPDLVPGATLMHCACVNAKKETIEMLLAAGAESSARDDGGKTPLDLAMSGGREDIVEILKAAAGPEE